MTRREALSRFGALLLYALPGAAIVRRVLAERREREERRKAVGRWIRQQYSTLTPCDLMEARSRFVARGFLVPREFEADLAERRPRLGASPLAGALPALEAERAEDEYTAALLRNMGVAASADERGG